MDASHAHADHDAFKVRHLQRLVQRLEADISLDAWGRVQLSDIPDVVTRAIVSDQIRGAG